MIPIPLLWPCRAAATKTAWRCQLEMWSGYIMCRNRNASWVPCRPRRMNRHAYESYSPHFLPGGKPRAPRLCKNSLTPTVVVSACNCKVKMSCAGSWAILQFPAGSSPVAFCVLHVRNTFFLLGSRADPSFTSALRTSRHIEMIHTASTAILRKQMTLGGNILTIMPPKHITKLTPVFSKWTFPFSPEFDTRDCRMFRGNREAQAPPAQKSLKNHDVT
jgi:hypothetical protein